MGDPWFYYRTPRPFPAFDHRLRMWPARWQGWLLIAVGWGLLLSVKRVVAIWGMAGGWTIAILLVAVAVVARLNTEEAPAERRRKGDLRDS